MKLDVEGGKVKCAEKDTMMMVEVTQNNNNIIGDAWKQCQNWYIYGVVDMETSDTTKTNYHIENIDNREKLMRKMHDYCSKGFGKMITGGVEKQGNGDVRQG